MTKATQKTFDLIYLLHPSQVFQRPTDVLEDPDLTVSEKRAILASWASDACAVEDAPALRRPTHAAPITFDDVMDALKTLDGAEAEKPAYAKLMTRAQRLKAVLQSDSHSGPVGAPILLRTRERGGGEEPDHSPTA
jgi:hypothetical protein